MNNYFSNRSFFSFSSSNNNSSFKIKTPGLQLRLPCPTYLKRRMNLVLRMLQVNQRIKTKLNKNYKKQNKVLNPPNRCNSIKIVLPLKKMLSPYPKSIISWNLPPNSHPNKKSQQISKKNNPTPKSPCLPLYLSTRFNPQTNPAKVPAQPPPAPLPPSEPTEKRNQPGSPMLTKASSRRSRKRRGRARRSWRTILGWRCRRIKRMSRWITWIVGLGSRKLGWSLMESRLRQGFRKGKRLMDLEMVGSRTIRGMASIKWKSGEVKICEIGIALWAHMTQMSSAISLRTREKRVEEVQELEMVRMQKTGGLRKTDSLPRSQGWGKSSISVIWRRETSNWRSKWQKCRGR